MGEWLLSRMDRVIVAGHEVPGKRCGVLLKALYFLVGLKFILITS
jgi:hypothetical protein